MTNDQRRQRQIDAERGIGGRGWREVEQGEADYDQAVLKQELEGGHFDPLGDGIFYSQGNGDTWRFKDKNGKLVNGTPEMIAKARADQANWSDAYNAGSGGGAGGPTFGPKQAADLESETNDFIRRLMNGEEGPYTEKIQAGMRGKVAEENSADLLNANRAATLAAARGGTSGTVGNILAANARGARSGIAEGNQGIDFQAATENAKSKIQGLQAAQDTIQRKYQDAWNKATDATQRAGIEAQMKAAMAKLQAEKDIAQKQADAERISGAAGRAFSEHMFDRTNERNDYEYQRDLPTNTYRNSGLGG